MKKKWYYIDSHKAKWLIVIISMSRDVRYNQGWRHYDQHPTVKYVLPRDGSEEQRGCVLGQGTVSLPGRNLDINRVHFVGPGGRLYRHEGNPREHNYLYWTNIWIKFWSRHNITEKSSRRKWIMHVMKNWGFNYLPRNNPRKSASGIYITL